MLQVSMVHAEADAALARDFGSYLERNRLAQVDYPLVTSDAPILDVVARALSSDVLILFVSPHSVPRRLDRDQWEPLFIEAAEQHQTHVGYVLIADCPFPKVLLRANVFGSNRELKRWILTLRPLPERLDFAPQQPEVEVPLEELQELWVAIADKPGSAKVADIQTARAFARQARPEFHAVFWVDCHGATVACVAGDLGAQLGMRLPNEIASNLERIRALCNEYRCLVVLEGASGPVLDEFGTLGLTSVLLSGGPGEASTLEVISQQFQALSAWMNETKLVPPSGRIHASIEWLAGQPEQWLLACQFSRAAIAFYKFHQRFAEAFEAIDVTLTHAISRRDPVAANEFGQERAWILDGWGRPPEAVHPFAVEQAPAVQLGLW